jgi:hypothetical protein
VKEAGTYQGLWNAGEFDAEGGAFTGFGLDGDMAAVFFDDAAGGGEAEAGAALFGSEVGIEDAGEVVGGDANAGIGDVEDGGIFGLDGLDQEFSPSLSPAAGGGGTGGDLGSGGAGLGFGRHSLNGVEEEVEEGLFEEVDIEGAERVFASERGMDADVGSLSLRKEEIDEFFDELIEGDDLGAELDTAGVAEEIVEGLTEAVGFFFEGSEARQGALARTAGDGGEIFFEELKIELESGEGVFKFMGETGGEVAHFGEMLEALQTFGLAGETARAARMFAGRIGGRRDGGCLRIGHAHRVRVGREEGKGLTV